LSQTVVLTNVIDRMVWPRCIILKYDRWPQKKVSIALSPPCRPPADIIAL